VLFSGKTIAAIVWIEYISEIKKKERSLAGLIKNTH